MNKRRPAYPLICGKFEYDLAELQTFSHIFSEINEYLASHQDTGVFVKHSQKSAKNDFDMFPARTLDDVFENLVHSRDVLCTISISQHIVLRPWLGFDKNDEFRVFVEDKLIICISQQFIYSPLKRRVNVDGLVEKLEAVVQQMKYSDAVLDVNYTNQILTLIEINPGCRWHGSGSAGFSWNEIADLRQKREAGAKVVVRVLYDANTQ